MRIEQYELIREYKMNKVSLRFLAAVAILAAIFLTYAIISTNQTRNQIEAGQESLAIRASQLQSELDELKREIEATPCPTPVPTTILTDETITDLWMPGETEPEYKISCSPAERLLFEQIVAAEVDQRTWGYEGYYLIAQTVANQLADGYWGNTLADVLTYKDNYSLYASGRYLEVDVPDLAREAVEEVLKGTKPISLYDYGHETLESILYFCTESHLNRHPAGFHASQTEIMRYKGVVFFSKN